MKVFAILFVTIAVASMAAAGGRHGSSSSSDSECGGLAGVLGPLLRCLQPLMNGVNGGLQAGSRDIGKGVHQLGSGLDHTVCGVGDIVSNAASGAGGTVQALPCGLHRTLHNLQAQNSGLVGKTLDTLTGANSH